MISDAFTKKTVALVAAAPKAAAAAAAAAILNAATPESAEASALGSELGAVPPPQPAAEASKKRKRTTGSDVQISSGLPRKHESKRGGSESERLTRTLFAGNVPVATKARHLAQHFQAALGTDSSGSSATATVAAWATADAVAADSGTVEKSSNLTRDVECVRFRSVAIEPVAVTPGSDYKKMRRAAFIKGQLDTGRTAMNGGEGGLA